MSKWVQGTVVGRRDWADNLYSLQVAAPEVGFAAGQFARLALPAPPGAEAQPPTAHRKDIRAYPMLPVPMKSRP